MSRKNVYTLLVETFIQTLRENYQITISLISGFSKR